MGEGKHILKKLIDKEKIVIYLLLSHPIFFYLYLLFPDTPSMNIFNIKFLSIFFESHQFFFWLLLLKASLILLLSIWFFFNKEWWRYTILPILLYTTFQFISILNDELSFLPRFQPYFFFYFFMFPLVLYLFLDKLIDYNPEILNDKIDSLTEDTLERLIKFDSNDFQDYRKELEVLRKKKNQLTKKEYLIQLMAIQTVIEKTIIKKI